MDVSVQFVWKAPERLEKVHWKFHWWHACISMVPAHYPYSVSVMSCSQCVGWHTFCLSTLYFWPYVEFIRTQTEHVHPGHVRAKLCYKWVYAAVIYSNETFLNIFSSFYPKAHKVITLVMTQLWVSETIKRVSDRLSFFHSQWMSTSRALSRCSLPQPIVRLQRGRAPTQRLWLILDGCSGGRHTSACSGTGRCVRWHDSLRAWGDARVYLYSHST